jgi:hypothetical protein
MSGWSATLADLALAAVVLGLAAVVATRVAGAMLPPSADALDRIGVSAMVGVIGWVMLLQVLGLAGILWLPVVIGCLAIMEGLSVRFLPRAGGQHRAGSRIPWGAIAIAVPFAVMAIVDVASVQPGLYFSDSIRYHIPNAAQILESGSIRGLPFAQAGDGSAASPGNGALLLLAVMLPLHTDALVGVVALCAACLLVVVVAMLCRELGRSAWVGAGCGLVIVTTWAFFGTEIASAYDDGIGLLGLASGIAFGLRYARTEQLRWLLLAGAGIGLAVGAKDVDILPGVAVAVAAVCIAGLWRRPAQLATLLAACLCLSLAWYVRDWVVTGDPFFPESIRLGQAVLFAGSGSPSPPGTGRSLIGAILAGQGAFLWSWLGIALVSFGPSLATIPLCLPLAWRSGGAPRAIALLGLACTAAFMVTPFTGSGSFLGAAIRYLLPGLLFSAVAVAAVVPRRWLAPLGAAALIFNAIALPIEASSANFPVAALWAAVAAAVVLLALVPVWSRVVSLARSSWIRWGAAAVALVLVVLAIEHLQPSASSTPVDRALAAARNPHAPVVVIDVDDVTAILGPQLDVNVVAAGIGPVGAETPFRYPGQLTARIRSLHPAAVVVGTWTVAGSIPPGWKPPGSWRRLGHEGGAVVYEP